jgi:hypothetical protein
LGYLQKDSSEIIATDSQILKIIFFNVKFISREIAPNPAKAVTTIFYNFVNTKATKSIELIDVLGRTLETWNLQDSKGTIEIDCSKYANGQYLILMKENDAIIKNTKLLTN